MCISTKREESDGVLGSGTWHYTNYMEYGVPTLLVSAGVERIFFPAAVNAIFWIQCGNKTDNTLMFLLFLSSACLKLKTLQCLVVCQ